MPYKEKTFEEKVKQINAKKKFSLILIGIIIVFCIIMGIIDIIPKDIVYTEFEKQETLDNSQYSTTNIYYLTELGIKATNSTNQEIEYFYIATGENDEMFIISAKDTGNIPIYGKDISQDSEIEQLEKIEIKGKRMVVQPSLKKLVIQNLNNVFQEEIANDNNVSQLLGDYYLDITPSENSYYKSLFMLAGFLAIIFVVYYDRFRKGKQEIDNFINEIKENGKYDEIKKDYETGNIIEYKKLNVDISDKFLFSYMNGITIIELNNIKDVSAEKKIDQSLKRYKYIVIEDKSGTKYYIAPQTKKKQKLIFEELLAKLKTKIR